MSPPQPQRGSPAAGGGGCFVCGWAGRGVRGSVRSPVQKDIKTHLKMRTFAAVAAAAGFLGLADAHLCTLQPLQRGGCVSCRSRAARSAARARAPPGLGLPRGGRGGSREARGAQQGAGVLCRGARRPPLCLLRPSCRCCTSTAPGDVQRCCSPSPSLNHHTLLSAPPSPRSATGAASPGAAACQTLQGPCPNTTVGAPATAYVAGEVATVTIMKNADHYNPTARAYVHFTSDDDTTARPFFLTPVSPLSLASTPFTRGTQRATLLPSCGTPRARRRSWACTLTRRRATCPSTTCPSRSPPP